MINQVVPLSDKNSSRLTSTNCTYNCIAMGYATLLLETCPHRGALSVGEYNSVVTSHSGAIIIRVDLKHSALGITETGNAKSNQ